MYKLLLSWRYLLTRYIALASIVSMTLGVATMIVVNAVMLGFTTEMENRIHGMLSDLIFEVRNLEAIPNPEQHIEKIKRIAGDDIAGISPTVTTAAMLGFRVNDQYGTRQVHLIGIDVDSQGSVSNIRDYLQHPENRENISFILKQNGYDVVSSQNPTRSHVRPDLERAGWDYRRTVVAERERIRRINDQFRKQNEAVLQKEQQKQNQVDSDGFDDGLRLLDYVNELQDDKEVFDPAKSQHTGVIVGFGLTQYDREEMIDEKTGKSRLEDRLLFRPGDDITLTFPTAGQIPKVAQDTFTVVDLFESRMAEHDQQFVFVPIQELQRLRGMIDPETGVSSATQIMIKAKPGVNLNKLRDKIRAEFRDSYQIIYSVRTWQDCQAPLLNAVFTEVAILNVLLFLIFAVAGFGILAIFFMIVVEKTKDIGILKSLGASGTGVMQIFLMYSLSLGIVGAGIGVGLGLLFVAYIKEIADVLSRLIGHNIFDPTVYSFSDVPAIIQPATVAWIVFGAIFIAVCSGVLPALRAAKMKPVESLRG